MVKPTASVRAERFKAWYANQRFRPANKHEQPSAIGNRAQRRAARKLKQKEEPTMIYHTVADLIAALEELPRDAPLIGLAAERQGVIAVPQDGGAVLIASPPRASTDIKEG